MRRVLTVAALTLVVGVAGRSWSVRAEIVPGGLPWFAPVLANPAAPAQAFKPPPQIADAENRAVNLLMYRDRDRERLLLHAQNQLQEGNVSAGVECLQRILDFEEDLFVWRKSDGGLASLRGEALELLGQLNAADFASYKRRVAADAGVLLQEAMNSGDAKLYLQVARRYFSTEHGFQATHWLATRWFDHGHFELAARAWESLESDPRHRHRVTASIRLKVKTARNRSTQPTEAPSPIIRVADRRVYPVSADDSRLDVIPALSTIHEPRRSHSWKMFQGGGKRSESVSATTPFLHPCWIHPFAAEPTSPLTTAIKLWEEKQGKALKSMATALFPIVVRQNVVYRDVDGIRCIDLETGSPRWNYRCQTSLQQEIQRLDEKHGSGGVHSSRSSSYVQTQADYAANSVLGMLSSDGQRVFAVDAMVLDSSASESASTDQKSASTFDPRKCNQLVALPLTANDPTTIQPLWTAGGIASERDPLPVLEGHFFRGPPLPMDGRLFAVTECRNQVNLVALDPETGELLWKQGIAFADDTFEVNQNRYPLACPIAFGEGVLVCPTQTGLLVGVDALSGMLLWSYCYAEELYQNNSRGWRDRYRKSWGSEGFPSAPKIHGSRIVLLPRQSGEIHCVDVRSGRRLWTTEREDGEYIGAVTEKSVFVVGQRYCRGLSLAHGQEQWSARFGMPAGQGLHAGGRYFLPLESGRIAAIHLNSGREIGLSGWRTAYDSSPANPELLSELTARVGLTTEALPTGWKTGNLIPAGDRILACGPRGLIAFPQTGELLNRQVRNRLLQSPRDLSTRLLAAELQLNLGHLSAAKTNLETVLAPDEPHPLKPHGEFLMRELLFRQLETHPEAAELVLAELESLASSPADRGRFLMRQADFQLQAGNPLAAWESLQELVRLDDNGMLPWPRNPDHTISPRSFAGRMMSRIRERLDAPQLARLERHIEEECQRLLHNGGSRSMREFLALYEEWPQSPAIRQKLAEQAKDRGEFQRAEFLWLKNRESQDLVVVAEANRQLIHLWNQLGLYSEAAQIAEELSAPKFQAISLKNAHFSAGNDFLQTPELRMLGHAIQRRKLPEYPIGRVEITEQRWRSMDKELLDAFGQYRREFSLQPGSTFQLLDKGWVDEEVEHPETRVAVIDRTAGLIQGKVRIPLRNSYPSLSKRAHVGHFFPVGSINRMTGVSLLEFDDEQPLWKQKLGNDAAHQHILRVGPAGPDYCTFQGQQELLVLDPATGKTLWKRADIDPSSGLVSDPYAGLFGDDKVLVLFGSHRSSYTVFQTATGEELHHGTLEIDTGQIRRIFGRKLFYIANTDQGRRMRIWDFLEDELVFDQPAGSRIYTALTPEQNLVVLIPPEPSEEEASQDESLPSRLQIHDVVADRVLLDLKIPAEDLKNLNYVRAFQHAGRFYVNLQRSVQMPVERLFSYYASDAFPPVENIQGDLLAIEPETGKVLWKRTIPQRSILRMPELRLPFLVMISRVRDRWQGGKQGLLVEILDANTGETIARKDNNLSDRVVNLAYDRNRGFLDLNGLKTRIRLKFGPALAKIPASDEPF